MKLTADHNYGTKDLHGLRWGISVFVNDQKKIAVTQLGGSLERLPNQDLSLVQGRDLLVFGNIWVHKDVVERTRFRTPQQLNQLGVTWWYWDNPELPHLLYKGVWNPHGHKNFLRLVCNNTVTVASTPTTVEPQHLNDQLHQITDGKITSWQQCVGQRRDVKPRGRKILIAPSGALVFVHYYHKDKLKWIKNCVRVCEQQGYEPVIRHKPSRSAREGTAGRLCDQLIQQDFAAVWCHHSVMPVESQLAGVPTITDGACTEMPASITSTQFEQGVPLPHCDADQITHSVNSVMQHTHHKWSAIHGTW